MFEIPRSNIPMGGPTLPAPAWFRDQHNFVWFRCTCGSIATIHPSMIAADGTIDFGLQHTCGFIQIPVRLNGFGG